MYEKSLNIGKNSYKDLFNLQSHHKSPIQTVRVPKKEQQIKYTSKLRKTKYSCKLKKGVRT